MAQLILPLFTQRPSQDLTRSTECPHISIQVADGQRKHLPFRNLFDKEDATTQLFMRCYSIGDPRLNLKRKRGRLMCCDRSRRDDVCPVSQIHIVIKYQSTKTEGGRVLCAPWQLGRLFFAFYANDSNIGNVWMLQKERLEFSRWYCESISVAVEDGTQIYLPWKP